MISYSKDTNQEGVIYLLIKITLTNTSSDTVPYLGIICPWQNDYVIDTRYIRLTAETCNENIPVLIKIPPHGHENRTLNLISLNTINQLNNLKFRVGFKFVPAIIADDAKKLFKRSKNILWSNIMCLK